MENTNEIKVKILGTAKELFSKYGFNNVTTDGLAKELGMSKRTIYQFFNSKVHLYEEIIANMIHNNQAKAEVIVERITNDEYVDFFEELDKLWGILRNVLACFKTEFYRDIKSISPDMMKKVTEHRNKHVKSIFNDIYTYGVEKGIFKSEINFEVVFLMQISFVQYMVDKEIMAELPINSDDLTADVRKIFFTGILTDDSRKGFHV